MKTKTIKIFTIQELSDTAKGTAHNNWLSHFDYAWSEENKDSLKAFEKLFPVHIKDWSYGDRSESVSFEMDEELSELKGKELKDYIIANYGNKLGKEPNCVLTGYCIDDSLLMPIYEFLKKPSDISFRELIEESFHKWVKDCSSDMEYQASMESFIESCDANDYTFTESGEMENI